MTARKRKVEPADPQKLRLKKPSEYTDRDHADNAWRNGIERAAQEANSDQDKRETILFVAIRLAMLNPPFARELADTLRDILKSQRPFGDFIRKATRKA